MTIQQKKAGAQGFRAQEKQIFDFMLKQSQAMVLAALAERKAILKFKEQYFKNPQ